MNIKSERAMNNAISQTNGSKWEQAKKWGRRTLLAAVSTVSLTVGMLGTSQQMSAQNRQVIEMSVDDLANYLNNRQKSSTQTSKKQYAQVYANRDAYRQARQQGVSVSADGRYAYDKGRTYVFSAEFNDNLDYTLNDRAILGIYQDIHGKNDYITVTAPLDRYGRIIPDGKLTAAHHSYEYLRDAKEQGHSGFRKSRGYSGGGYYAPYGGRGERIVRGVDEVVRGTINIVRGARGGR